MIKLLRSFSSFLLLLGLSLTSRAQMRITEFMYDGNNGEFIEFTNVGSTPVDMTGYSFSDNGRAPDAVPLSAYGIVQPGESVILTDAAASAFRTAWGLCAGVKIIGGNTVNLGRSDEINLYDALDAQVDRLTYGDQVYSGTIRTQTKSGWVSAAGLGANTIASWTLSAVADAESSFTSTGGDIGSPGKSTRATVAYDPCAVTSGAPTIVIDVASTSNFLDGGVTTSPVSPYSISGVKGDAGDPAMVSGIDFTIGDDATPVGSLTVTVTSSNTTVVPNANLVLTGTGASRNLKITPGAAGYSNITVTVNDGTNNTSYVLAYAASQTGATATYWPTGFADASAAIALDDDYMIIANDESNLLYVLDRKHSGLPVTTFDFNQSNILALTDGSSGVYKEVDVEAAVSSVATAGKTYWLGSMSNSSSFNNKPNRDRIFAVNVSGTGSTTAFANAGSYSGLRAKLIAWGDSYGYDFTTSAANGKDPKTIDGFNLEGMVFAPDGTTLYLGFRAPLVPTANRTRAVIAPIHNFETWFNNGAPSGNPTIGAPIELDLAGRGIRDIIRLSNNNYVILAGSYGSAQVAAVYTWTGNASDAPTLVANMDISALNAEAVLPVNMGGSLALDRLQIISDDGDHAFYNDAIAAKDLTADNWKKFNNNIIISAAGSVLPVTFEYFTAVKKDRSVQLTWKTDAPQGIARFEVLRSDNGSDFSVIGTVAAYAVQTLYTFTDDAITGRNKWYYRIRAVEESGQANYTAVRSVDLSGNQAYVQLYPNPVSNDRVSLVVNKAGVKTVQVYAASGVLMQQYSFSEQAKDIPTRGWAKGYYVLVIRTDDGAVVTQKLVVQ
jgi:hypothetical protein